VWVLGHAGESMIVTDPKGERYAHCAAWLRGYGYRVVLPDLPRRRPGGTGGTRWYLWTAKEYMEAYVKDNAGRAVMKALAEVEAVPGLILGAAGEVRGRAA
jgi:hypothetical protein